MSTKHNGLLEKEKQGQQTIQTTQQETVNRQTVRQPAQETGEVDISDFEIIEFRSKTEADLMRSCTALRRTKNSRSMRGRRGGTITRFQEFLYEI